MSSDAHSKEPVFDPAVIETPVGGGAAPLTGEQALALRLRQQELLAKLGVLALQGSTLKELLERAARLTAEGLEAEFCKVMEYQPAKNCFVVRAGVGWDIDTVGKATVGADMESPAGYALHTGKPVISNHLEREQRFRTPQLLMRHGIRRAINVILQGDKSAYGVLEVDSRSPGEFNEHDLAFLQGAANIVGMAIERQRIERDLLAAADRHRLLLDELNHRVKNSLQIAAATLELQASSTEDETLRTALTEASGRIVAIGRAHEGLYRGDKVASIDLAGYLAEVCHGLETSAVGCRVEFTAPAGRMLDIETDRAVPVALVVNELVTNAIKYGQPGGVGCRVQVRLGVEGRDMVLSVSDNGVGLPEEFDIAKGRGLGMRMVRAFSRQLEGTLKVNRLSPGTEFVLRFPARDGVRLVSG
jgi:two-component sensor histidine kinase